MRAVLIGNYGVGNLGDEALKEYFLKRFPDVQWTVLSASPKSQNEVPRVPIGPRSFLMTPWWKTLGALWSSDAVVFGGGSLFTDVESVFACVLWWWHAIVARAFGKKIFLAFQGIGPFKSRVGEWCAQWVIKRSTFVSVRDHESAMRAKRSVIESFDPVVLLISARTTHAPDDVLSLIPRMNSGMKFSQAAKDVITDTRPRSVRILSMQSESSAEQSVCSQLAAEIGAIATVHAVASLEDLVRELRGCSHVVTERFHGALVAMALGITTGVIAQRPGDKLDTLSVAAKDVTAFEELRNKALGGERELQKAINMVK